MLYHIQTKIRDEARPRGGLLRIREFFMKDAYSFHRDFADLDAYYPKIFNAYLRIFARCGVESIPIQADSGIMGGTGSHEFMLESPNGEDRFVVCTHCDYRANTEKAEGVKQSLTKQNALPPPMTRVSTPGVKTIADLMRFFDTGEASFLKTVAYEADGELASPVSKKRPIVGDGLDSRSGNSRHRRRRGILFSSALLHALCLFRIPHGSSRNGCIPQNGLRRWAIRA